MLNVLHAIPPGLLDAQAPELHELLGGPTLIHLDGRRAQPLFVSVLLHGNETSGWDAVTDVLREYSTRGLPRALSLFIGNVEAARDGRRHLDDQVDFNRVWSDGDAPWHAMTARVVDEMRARDVAFSIDIHNNTGRNPHYGCVNRLDDAFLQLARLFSRNVVYFLRPDTVQSMAFSALCPAVTVECGQADDPAGASHAAEFVRAVLNVSQLPEHPVAPQDIDVFHTVATVRVDPACDFAFDDTARDLRLEPALDRLNFAEVAAGTRIATRTSAFDTPLDVTDERGRSITSDVLADAGDGIVFRESVIPVDAHARRGSHPAGLSVLSHGAVPVARRPRVAVNHPEVKR